jgi:hypothetical protein
MPEKKGSTQDRRPPYRHRNPDPVRRLLRRAHQMMEVGKHTDAANIFENLAQKAEDRGKLRHAPYLYLQAGRANLLAGNAGSGSDLIQHGLSILGIEKRWSALARSGKRVLDELQGFGFFAFAEEVSSFLISTLPESVHNILESPQKTRTLPLTCPECYGVLWPEEVESIDSDAVECPYCGAAIRGD